MAELDPHADGSAVAALLEGDRICDLGPGLARQDSRDRLEALDRQSLFGPRQIVDSAMADSCLAGLWLLHDSCYQNAIGNRLA